MDSDKIDQNIRSGYYESLRKITLKIESKDCVKEMKIGLTIFSLFLLIIHTN